jgi:hypothetical protein
MLTGLKYQLFDHIHHATWINVYVPAVVLEELVANHARAVAKVEAATQHVERDRRLVGPPGRSGYGVGLPQIRPGALRPTTLFTVLPWPQTAHQELAMRAVNRTAAVQREGDGIPGRARVGGRG